MRSNSLILVFLLTFFLTTPSNAAPPIDLSTWTVIQYKFTDRPDPNWALSNNNTVATQTVNSDASILIGDFDITDKVVEGSWRVDSNNDNDYIGFVFGYQGPGQYYLFDWKKTDQSAEAGFAEKGMSLKVVDVVNGGEPTELDLWPTSGSDNVSVLRHNNIGWMSFTDYNFHLEFHAGHFTIEVREGVTVLESWSIFDDKFTNGLFGFYNYSQGTVVYQCSAQQIINSLAISPPSGSYVTTQQFDLTLIVRVESEGTTVAGGSATFDGADVTANLASCLIPGTLVSGGWTFRCPGISVDSLGTGTHNLDVTLDLSDGSSVSDNVTWVVKENTDP